MNYCLTDAKYNLLHTSFTHFRLEYIFSEYLQHRKYNVDITN